VEALARALVDLGAHFVVVGTFHGDPLHNMAIHRGLAPLRRSGARVAEPFLEALRALTRGAATEYDAALLPIDSLTLRHAVRESLPFDFHAGYVETSLALYFACDSVDTAHRSVSPCPRFRVAEPWARLSANARRLGRSALADELRMVGIATGWHALRPFPGYTGFPGLASREAGRVYGEALVELYLETVRGVFQGTGAATSPPLAWLEWLTARGRLA
jgi:creatinine amidohydrolase